MFKIDDDVKMTAAREERLKERKTERDVHDVDDDDDDDDIEFKC